MDRMKILQSQIFQYRVATLCVATILFGARMATAQFASTPPAPAAPPAPPSATIPNTGQPQFSATPVIMMNPQGGLAGATGTAGATTGAAMGGFPGASVVIVPTMTQPTSSSQNLNENKSHSDILVPAGTRVLLSLQRTLNMHTTRVGDAVYFRSSFPVVVERHVVIPAGAFVQGQVDAILPASRSSLHKVVRMRLTTLILPDGRVVSIPGPAFNSAYASTVTGQSERMSVRNPGGRIVQGTSMELTLKRPLRIQQPVQTPVANSNGAAGIQPIFIPFSSPSSTAPQPPTAKTSGASSASSASRFIKTR